MDTSVLEDIGLTNAQIKVYLALLELGETTSGPIIKKSGLQNSVVYNALNQLIDKGLVVFVTKGKRKNFSISDPKNLVKFIDDKKKKIEEILPQLKERQRISEEKHEAKVFIGWKGVYAAFNYILEVLPKGSDYIAFGAGIGEQYSKEASDFFREYSKKRYNMKYKVKLISNESAREQVKKSYSFKIGKPDWRFVKGIAPLATIIFTEHIMFVAFEETPSAIIIRDRQIAESYRQMFYAMWKIAKK